MVLPSSQPRRSFGIDARIVQRLLQDGAVLEEMPDPIVAHLTELGLIEAAPISFVLCSNHRDADYPPPSRDCLGRIRVSADDDRGICPECGRDVDLSDSGKKRSEGLQIRINERGIMTYVASAAMEFGTPVQAGPGLLRFRTDPTDVFVYVPELCHEEHHHRRDTATVNPTVVVTLEPSGPARVLPEPWLLRTTVAALVTGQAGLTRLLQTAASQPRPTTLLNASVPLFAGGVRPLIAKPPERPVRRFVLQISRDQAHVEGILIASRKSRAQLLILQILAKHFMRSLLSMSDMPSRPLPADKIADRLQRLTKKDEDRESVRRSINRVQDTIADRIKRELGLPIGREDVIQTVPWQGAEDPYGYQLHPENVLTGRCAGSIAQVSEEISNCRSRDS
jgi:hypothetical protein